MGNEYSYRIYAQNVNGKNSAYTETQSIAYVSHDDAILSFEALALWLKAGSGEFSAGKVLRLSDLSGNENHAQATNQTYRPALHFDAVNGQPSISFNAMGDALLKNGNGAFLQGKTEAEYFIVLKSGGIMGGRSFIFNQGSSFTQYEYSAANIYEPFGRTNPLSFARGKDLGGWHLYNVSSGNEVWQALLDGSILKMDNMAYPNYNNSYQISHTVSYLSWKGEIAEIFVFEKALSESERVSIEKYLGEKYALTISGRNIIAPNNLSVAREGKRVTLHWEAGDGRDNISYIIERRNSGTVVGPWQEMAVISDLSYIDATAVWGGSYQYRVKARIGYNDSAYTDSVSISLPNPSLGVPNAFSANIEGEGILLAWEGGEASPGTLYFVERREGNGAWMQIGSSSNTNFLDTSIVQGKNYSYRIRSGWEDLSSDYTDAIEVAIPLETQYPESLALNTDFREGRTILTWLDVGANRYRVERAELSEEGASVSFVHLAGLGGGIRSYADATGLPEMAYAYRVTAYDDNDMEIVSETVLRQAFAEPEAGDGILLWMKADEAAEVDEKGNVSEWFSAIGEFSFSQEEKTFRPLLIQNAVNGKPAIYFDGRITCMNVPYLGDGSMNLAVIAVAKEHGDRDDGDVLYCYGRNLFESNDTKWKERLACGGFRIYDVLNPQLMQSEGRVAYTEDTLGLGFNGEIAELIIYERDSLNVAQRAELLRYLEQKYDLYNGIKDVKLFGGSSHTLLLKSDGTLWAKGVNSHGQFGNGTTNSSRQDFYTQVPLENVVAAAAGDNRSLALTANGDLYLFGGIMDGANNYNRVWLEPRRIAVGVYCLGGNVYASNVGVFWLHPYQDNVDAPYEIPVDEKITQADSFGDMNAVLLKSGKVFYWGPANPFMGYYGSTTRIRGGNYYCGSGGFSDIIKIKVDYYSVTGISSDGSVYHWGKMGWDYAIWPATKLELPGKALDVKWYNTQEAISVLLEDGRIYDVYRTGKSPSFYTGFRPDLGTQNHAIVDSIILRKDGAMTSQVLTEAEDQDRDGLPDAWEMKHFGTLDYHGWDDPDGDGLYNFNEYARRTNPMTSDKDTWPNNGEWTLKYPWKARVHLKPLFDRYDKDFGSEGKTTSGLKFGRNEHYTPSAFRFWVNNDLDKGGASNTDWMDFAHSDALDNKINGEKDITDFFPVWIDLTTLFDRVDSIGGLPEDWSELNIYFLHENGMLNVTPYYFEGNTEKGGVSQPKLPHQSFESVKRLLLRHLINTAPSIEGDAFYPAIKKPAITVRKNSTSNYYIDEFNESMIIKWDYWKGLDNTKNRFGILLEAASATQHPLIMEIRTKSNQLLYRTEMPLSVTHVTKMYRHRNVVEVLRDENGQRKSEILPGYESRPEAPNFPDIYNDAKSFVFVHGYNVNQYEAEGGHNELFKNLFWTGSRMKFHGVTWYGNEPMPGGLEVTVQMNYQQDVINAFETAYYVGGLIDELNEAGDTVIVGGHSLGNMVVSSAIQDHGARPKMYLMFNGAVTKEAFDASEEDLTLDAELHSDGPKPRGMENPHWRKYDRGLWASDWHKLWSGMLLEDSDDGSLFADYRSKLTWKGRFGDVPHVTKFYNYYSSGENVLMAPSDDNPMWGYDDGFKFNMGDEPWRSQEQLKGKGPIQIGLGNSGGWSLSEYYSGMGQLVLDGVLLNTDKQRRERPLFDRDANVLHEEGLAGHVFARKNEARLLAQFVPALAWAAGGNPFAKELVKHSTDMNEIFQTHDEQGNPIWPIERLNNPKTQNRWNHSDLKNIAYPYIYRLYEDILNKEKHN